MDIYHDIACPGCDAPLTDDNVGGYRTYCLRCVDAMPELPAKAGEYCLVGRYPDFEWRNLTTTPPGGASHAHV